MLQIVSIFSKHDSWDVLSLGVYMVLVLIAKACLGCHNVAQSIANGCGAGECSILGHFSLVSMVLVIYFFTNMKKPTCKFSCFFMLVDCILHIDLSPV